MSLKKEFGKDRTKELVGTWIDVLENEDKTMCRMRLTRMHDRNAKLMKVAAEKRKLQKGSRASRSMPTVLDDDDMQKAREIFVDSILVDWENVVDYRVNDGGKTMMPFTRENALFLLEDLPDLFELLTQEARNPANFGIDEDEDAKN